MSAVWYRARTELRAGWRSAAVIVVLIGVAGGAALGAAAGARRTATAYDRYRSRLVSHDVSVGAEGTALAGFADEIARLPQVTASGLAAGLALTPLDRRGGAADACCQAYVSDGTFAYGIDRPNVVAGRLPRKDVATEAVANIAAARALGIRAGDTVRFRLDLATRGAGPPVKLTITGIGVAPNEVVPVTNFDTLPSLVVSPAFMGRFLDPKRVPFYLQVVTLDGDVEAFTDAAHAVAARHIREPLFVSSDADRIGRVRRALTPLSVALAGFAAVAAVALVLIVGQILARIVSLDAVNNARLVSLGMTAADLVRVAVARVVSIALAGAALAACIAIAVSPAMPVGPARLAEPDPGIEANLAVLAGGAAVIVLALLLAAAPAIRNAARGRDRSTRADAAPSPVMRALSRLELPPPVAVGSAMALARGRGRTAVPVLSTMLVGVTAIATVVMALTFGANLERFVGTPELYGQRWDELWDATFSGLAVGDLVGNPDLEALSGGDYQALQIESTQVSAVAIEPLVGDAYPVLLEGRRPDGADEIALGTRTLRSIGARVGDSVTVSMAPGDQRSMTVVGRVVFPRFGQGIFNPTGLGDGALLAFYRGPVPEGRAAEPGTFGFALVRYRRSVEARPTEAALSERCQAINEGGDLCSVERTQVPADLATYPQVRALPLILTALLALIAAGSIGHALVTSVRRRRRDLAVLKAVGFTARQLASTVGWQATTTIAVTLMFAVPLGIVGGRRTWIWLANTLGIPAEANVPWVALAIVIPAAWATARLIAALPGRAAARTHPAVVLRAE